MTWPFTIFPVVFSLISFFLVFLFLYLLVYWLGRREQRALCMYGLFAAVVTAPFDLMALQDANPSMLVYFTAPAWGMVALSVPSLLKSWPNMRYTACWLAATALHLLNAALYTQLTLWVMQ